VLYAIEEGIYASCLDIVFRCQLQQLLDLRPVLVSWYAGWLVRGPSCHCYFYTDESNQFFALCVRYLGMCLATEAKRVQEYFSVPGDWVRVFMRLQRLQFRK
jgi:hypothetical protein